MESPAQPTPAGTPKPNSTQPPWEISFLQSPSPQSCLDPKGDLYVKVGSPSAKCFKVCSRTVARTSIFWDKLLYGGFKESKKPCPQDDNQEWIVELPEDHPGAMELLFNIIHGRFDTIPRYNEKIDVDVLYNISVITDKYDMAHILQPWARGWLQSTIRLDKPHYGGLFEQHYKQLWISWVLGDKANFEEIAKTILLYFYPHCIRPSSILEPPEIYGQPNYRPIITYVEAKLFIIDIIEKTRLDTIKALLELFSTIIERLINKDEGLCLKTTERWKHTDSCIPSMLGTGIQSLRSLGLWPIPQPTEWRLDVMTLSNQLKSVKIESKTKGYNPCSHVPALQGKINKVLDSIPSLLTEVHVRHLECQARKTGVFKKRNIIY
ncbi:hypothetical protein NPX13_g4533 [Xylaria arbuscula]|uniref:BTB domain-containing protein n=1 Tax=Xylaria arbuscula TaxID=114810 RepID=A0A9W8NG60_9PEZI|nr:hypothetical protein NPX13_g4533 [Xylaria arbuscula]